MTEQNEEDAPSSELVLRRQTAQLEIWQARQLLAVERERAALEVERATGLMERRLQARALAASELVPAGFRIPKNTPPNRMEAELDKAAANILLAEELGKSLGLTGIEALTQLQVVEGNIGWAPVSARGRIMAAGHPVRDELETNQHGVPTAWTIRTERNGEPYEIRFTLDHAARMGLCRLEYAEGQPEVLANVTAVKARSAKGNAMPWETATEDMLCWRASSRLKRIYADILSGVNFATEYERPEEQPPPAPQVIRELNATRAATDADSLRADLERAGPTWWEHAGQGANVRRRNPKQAAADRLWDVYQADPDGFPGPTPPTVAQAVAEEVDAGARMVAEAQGYVDAFGSTAADTARANAALEVPTVVPHVSEVPSGGPMEEVPLPPEPYGTPDLPPVGWQGEDHDYDSAVRGEPDAEDERARLLTLLDDYVQRTSMTRDALTLRARTVYAAPGGPVPEVETLTTEQLGEVLDAIGPMVDNFA